MTKYNKFNKGSEWRKWDLHIHAPSKYTNAKQDRFLGDNLSEKQNQFIVDLQQVQDISVLGVTDYFSLDGYKFVLSRKESLSNIEFLLPNIELRISPVTGDNRKINLHIIPNTDELTIDEIERFLYKFEFGPDRLTCRECDLISLGRKIKPEASDEEAFKKGLNEFHISYDKFFEVFNASSERFKKNVIIGVSNNSGDGASGIKDIQGIRDIIYSGIDFIFSSQSSDRKYFSGKGADSEAKIISKYSGLKPCIHGSDFHGGKDGKSICVPDLNRFCWIKADPTFEGLKQVLYEPTDRVFIGEDKPDDKLVYHIIDKIKFQDPNFTSNDIEINQNLTAIIGGKSTGKSVLLKNIAKTIDPEEYHKRLKTAGLPDSKPILGMEVHWKDGQISNLDSGDNPNKRIIYIPQSYLNRVVDYEKKNTDIDNIIKEVLLQDSDFNEWYSLLSLKEKSINDGIEKAVKSLYENISVHNENNSELKKTGDEKGVDEQIKKITQEIKGIQDKLKVKQQDIDTFNLLNDKVKKEKLEIRFLQDDVKNLNLLKEIKISIYNPFEFDFKSVSISNEVYEITDSKSNSYSTDWKKEIEELITKNLKKLDELISDNLKEVGVLKPLQEKIDGKRSLAKKYKELEEEERKHQVILNFKKKKLDARSEIDKLVKKLSEFSADFYSIFLEAKDKIKLDHLDDDLEFGIKTEFRDNYFQESFIRSFFDGRKINKIDYDYLTKFKFSSKESFKEFIHKIIWELLKSNLPTRNEGSSKEVITGLLKNWFIHDYKVQYQGDQINDMSPGKKSFVLLRLLVDLDNSKCPILIDQPEDDLDNRSIYNQVVKFLRKRKSQRQIIIATHNPNLVLGADAEQIIVANQEGKDTKNISSKFEYVSGAIEHSLILDNSIIEVLYKRGIQEHVCDVLEGGEEAFNKRKNKYNF